MPENSRCLSEIVADKFTFPNSYSIRQTFGIKNDVYLFTCVCMGGGGGLDCNTSPPPQKKDLASNSIVNQPRYRKSSISKIKVGMKIINFVQKVDLDKDKIFFF